MLVCFYVIVVEEFLICSRKGRTFHVYLIALSKPFPKNFRIFEWHKEVFLVIIIFLYNKVI